MEEPLVYLVDDDVEFCKLMEAYLQDLGMQFKYFVTIPDFVEALNQEEPQLALIDLNYGKQDLGFQLIEQIREQKGPALPIVVVSRKTDVHSINYSLDLGANDYIMKPVDRTYLIEKLSMFFRTDEMMAFTTSDASIAEGNNEASFNVSAEILAIDEMGVRFSCPHLIVKGTTIHITSRVFNEIFDKETSPVLTVLSSQPIQGSSSYEFYAEISLQNEEITRSIRNWISEKTKSTAA